MEDIITDCRTDKVYFSTYIRPFRCGKELQPLLESEGIPYGFVPHTRDLWVRDFMPVQIRAGRYVQFAYAPDYLRGREEYRTDPHCCAVGLEGAVVQSDIVLDGGNLIKCDKEVILTDKVLADNPQYAPSRLVGMLENLLDAEVVLIPWDRNEICGHADGAVRYLGGGRVLLNHYADFDKAYRRKLLRVLAPRFEIAELVFGTARHLDWSWAYLNYMQVGERLFVPCFGRRADESALRQIGDFSGRSVFSVGCGSVVRLGGGLNCLSWNVKTI